MVPFLPEYITNLLDRLHKNGFKGYVVGGCVRDIYMQKTPHDYDVTTDATPQEIINLFEKTVATGIKHGTVTVITDAHPIEVTTFRTEGTYTDSRRPDSVTFVRNLKDDLSRRDFTVNALAYNPTEGLIDLFGGIKDLHAGILRAVGVPEERFTEDALRILRLFRFAVVLDFKIEEETLKAAIKKADTLQKISRERIAAELEKTVCGKNLSQFSVLLNKEYLNFLNLHPCDNLNIITFLPQNTELRYFAFLHLCCDNITAVGKELKFSNARNEYLRQMNLLINSVFETKADIKRALNKTCENAVRDALTVKKVLYKKNTQTAIMLLEEVLENNEPYLIKHLAINGNDLKEIGINGTNTGKTLNFLLDCIIQDKTLNTKEKLLLLAQNHRN